MSAVPVIDDAGTQELSAERAQTMAARFVGGLQRQGVEPGSRVVFQAPNSAALLAGVLGSLRGGYIPVVIGNRLTLRERDELTSDVDPRRFVDEAALVEAFGGPAATLTEDWQCRPMHFTSGTSGRPKGVWSGWLDPVQGAALVAEEISAWGITSADRHLVVAPLSHSAPLRFPLVALMAGATVVIPKAFDPTVVSRLMNEDQVTTTFMAPTHLQRLLDTSPPAHAAMRLVAHAGSACPDHVRRATRATFGDACVREFYGSTEGQFTICTPEEFDAHPGTVGRARAGRRLHIDDDRIWCQVPDHARFTYWGDPAKTAEAWSGDRFTVGDVGRLDDDGYLFLDGRRGDLIISGGVNVYPAEVERVLLDLPGVEQVVAFGAEDARWGQRVCVVVVGQVSEVDVAEHCARLLAPYKRPKSIHLADELPTTHSGKIDRIRVPQSLGL